MQACHANFSPIFGIYPDPGHKIDHLLTNIGTHQPPEISITDKDQIQHQLWVIKDQDTLAKIISAMATLPVYIADGHHRYETALHFYREMQAQGLSGFDRVLITLVNIYDPGLVIFPTHRLVRNLETWDWPTFQKKVSRHFDIETFFLPGLLDNSDQIVSEALQEVLHPMAIKGNEHHIFALYEGDTHLHLLTLKNPAELDQMLDPERSPGWRQLDVSILHTLILEQLLGIGTQQRLQESNLTYTQDALAAVRAVQTGSHQIAFLINATKVSQITEVAAAGDKMPQKSTYFYPKLITGLVLNPLGS